MRKYSLYVYDGFTGEWRFLLSGSRGILETFAVARSEREFEIREVVETVVWSQRRKE